MTRLTFALDTHTFGDVAVEVRKTNMALVGKTVASGSVTVNTAGTYVVSARLPTGEPLTKRVTVTDRDKDLTVTLAEGIAQPSATRGFAADEMLGVRSGAAASSASSWRLGGIEKPEPGASTLELWEASFLQNAPGAGRQLVKKLQRRSLLFEPLRIAGKSTAQWLRIAVADADQWIALPAWHPSGCTLSLDVDAPLEIHVALSHPQANLLIQLRNKGRIAEEQGATQSTSLTAEQLVQEKVGDPIAAVVGAYTLLRFNEIDRLHDWTGNLFQWFPQLPDAAAVRAEHLGRLGEHRDSLTALLTLERRGLPLFSEGLKLTIDRLTLYTRYGGDTFPAAETKAASDLLRRLQGFEAIVDYAHPMTTLFGPSPVLGRLDL